MSSLVQQLEAAKNSLTPETWRKGNYFANDNNTLCMCSHGALQVQVNPTCKAVVKGSWRHQVHAAIHPGVDIAAEEANGNVENAANIASISKLERIANDGGGIDAAVAGSDIVSPIDIVNALDASPRTLKQLALAAEAADVAKWVALNASNAARLGEGVFALRSDIQKLWDERPSWVKNNFTANGSDYGTKDAHYLLGMVGLTAAFNDRENTTLEMVHAKFDEAIELARQLNL
jgi:hypothetical protein